MTIKYPLRLTKDKYARPCERIVIVLTERFVDWQVSLDVENGSSRCLVFFNDMATTSVQHAIDATNGIFRTLHTQRLDVNSHDSYYHIGITTLAWK